MATVAKAGSEILVNTSTDRDQFDQKVTTLADGAFVVTWVDRSFGEVGSFTSAIKAQVFTTAGNKAGPEFLVNTAVAGDQIEPQITALTGGGFVVTWRDPSLGVGGATGDSSGSAVKAQVFTAAGAKTGSEILVNTATVSEQHTQKITALANGGFVVTWQDFSGGVGGATGDSSGWAVKAQVYTASGDKTGSEILVNTAVSSNQEAQQITALSDGGFVVTWQDLSQGNGGATGDNSGSAVKAQVFTAAGGKTGPEILVNTAIVDAQQVPQITALSNGGFVAAWQDNSSGNGGATGDSSGSAVKAQVFTAAGGKIGSEILVNTATLSSQQNQKITALSNGGFVVTWMDSSQGTGGAGGDANGFAIKAQVFTAAGDRTGSETLVNTTAAGDQGPPQIAALPNGAFVVTWRDPAPGIFGATTDDTSVSAVRAQAFTATGARIGSEFLVNTATAGDQQNPQIAALPDGFVVTWQDFSQGNGGATGDTSGYAIKAQLFSVELGATITGTAAADTIDATHAPAGQPFPTDEEDRIAGLGGNDTIHGLGGDDRIAGGGGNDTLYGDAGNDTLNGGGGADAMDGGDGDDRYFIDNAGDTVTDSSGVDLIFTTLDHSLGAGFERLYARSDAGLALSGNAAGNVIGGGTGDDTITGGGGRDVMTGGGGADHFVFGALSDSVTGGGRDLIKDFVAGTDTIDLAAIDANTGAANDQAFSFIGAGAFSHTAGELQAKAFGTNTLVSGDVDGNGTADFHILLSGSVALQATDFLL